MLSTPLNSKFRVDSHEHLHFNNLLKFRKSKSIFFAIFAVPAFPGIQKSFSHKGDLDIAQHNACSLPPDPKTKTFN